MYKKTEVVILRATPQERADIAKLAALTERSQSDAIRFAVRQVLRQMTGDTLPQATGEAIPHCAPADPVA